METAKAGQISVATGREANQGSGIGEDPRAAAYRRDLASAKSLKELAWAAIQSGAAPAYVAVRYGFPVERMIAAKQEHDRRETLERERKKSARGNREAFESRQEPDGS